MIREREQGGKGVGGEGGNDGGKGKGERGNGGRGRRSGGSCSHGTRARFAASHKRNEVEESARSRSFFFFLPFSCTSPNANKRTVLFGEDVVEQRGLASAERTPGSAHIKNGKRHDESIK